MKAADLLKLSQDGTAMPEWLTRKDTNPGSWTITAGLPIRGVPCTNIGERKMVVPLGASEKARSIRAHEMMHAKVSPVAIDTDALCGYYECAVSMGSFVAAEEMRVNQLCKLAGFDMDCLEDGSEKTTGKMHGDMGLSSWNSTVDMIVATFDTKACKQFIAGLKMSSPEQASLANEVVKQLRKFKRDMKLFMGGGCLAASTELVDEAQLPFVTQGFQVYTLPLARMVEQFKLTPSLDTSVEDGTPIERSDEDMAEEMRNRVGRRQVWAAPILRNVPLTRHLDGKIGRKRIASQTGRVPRHLDRLLTDPERRVFDRRSRGKGGVVLIDQSGSMHLTNDDIQQLLLAAPGCVIIGYSHAAGNSEGIPNIWIIANRGKVCEEIPEGNGGNGVDGPAIRYALTHRRTGEPFVWVCDGLVTDGATDAPADHLTQECAELVVKHRIHQVGDCDQAIEALKRAATSTLPTQAVGAIYDAARVIQRAAGHDC